MTIHTVLAKLGTLSRSVYDPCKGLTKSPNVSAQEAYSLYNYASAANCICEEINQLQNIIKEASVLADDLADKADSMVAEDNITGENDD